MMNMFVTSFSLTVEKINASNFKTKLMTKFLEAVDSFSITVKKINASDFKTKLAFKFFEVAEKQKTRKRGILRTTLNTSYRKDDQFMKKNEIKIISDENNSSEIDVDANDLMSLSDKEFNLS